MRESLCNLRHSRQNVRLVTSCLRSTFETPAKLILTGYDGIRVGVVVRYRTLVGCIYSVYNSDAYCMLTVARWTHKLVWTTCPDLVAQSPGVELATSRSRINALTTEPPSHFSTLFQGQGLWTKAKEKFRSTQGQHQWHPKIMPTGGKTILLNGSRDPSMRSQWHPSLF